MILRSHQMKIQSKMCSRSVKLMLNQRESHIKKMNKMDKKTLKLRWGMKKNLLHFWISMIVRGARTSTRSLLKSAAHHILNRLSFHKVMEKTRMCCRCWLKSSTSIRIYRQKSHLTKIETSLMMWANQCSQKVLSFQGLSNQSMWTLPWVWPARRWLTTLMILRFHLW